MAVQDRFPRALLAEPKEARLAYFRHKIVAHPRLKEVHQTLMSAIRQPTGVLLILVLGPTGVGKTTLRLGIEKQLREELSPELEQDLGRVPVVGVEAVERLLLAGFDCAR
jgi:Cdc6-like AAA superfamily ATPase